jgi:hypothetical protein
VDGVELGFEVAAFDSAGFELSEDGFSTDPPESALDDPERFAEPLRLSVL